ncbi:MAG: hypothetical protein KDD41_03115 [Flavobacteriales bacterium]|nr:hypothetical protein [Flavobacteriales bacterium]
MKDKIELIIDRSISLLLVFCLFFSSFSIYLSSSFFNDTKSDDQIITEAVSTVHHAKANGNDVFGEMLEEEEEDDDAIHKKIKLLQQTQLIRILWLANFDQTEDAPYFDDQDQVTTSLKEPCYIEYCSLKIPS